MKRTFLFMVISIAASTGVMVVLFLTSFDFSEQKNDFVRLFGDSVIVPTDTFDLGYNSYYFAGSAKGDIYFGNSTAPLHALRLNLTSGDTHHIQLVLKNTDTLQYWAAKLRIDSPYFFLGDGTQPYTYRGTIGTWFGERSVYDSCYFVEYIPIGSASFIFRSLYASTQEHELAKGQRFGQPNIFFNTNLLQKQIDGIFCLDGQLHYDETTHRVVYTHFYKNEFIVSDTNLNLLYRGKTIDSVRFVKLDVGKIESTQTRTLTKPPMLVNGLSFAANGYLFVNSKLLAMNEEADAYEKASVIDVYDIRDGRYMMSFYLHHFREKRMRAFAVTGNNLIVLIDHFVIVYQLHGSYFHTGEVE